MDCVPYPAQQPHMYRQHEQQQQQEKLQLQQQQQQLQQQQQQQQQLRRLQPQQHHQFRQRNQRGFGQQQQVFAHKHRPFFQTHQRQLPPRPRGKGRGGQHRVLISPILSDPDRYDFYPEGSVNVRSDSRGSLSLLNNNESDSNNNNTNTTIRADVDVTAPSTQPHHASGTGAASGTSKQSGVTQKGMVQIPQADYDNVVAAVPRLSRVLEEEGLLVTGGKEGLCGEGKTYEHGAQQQRANGTMEGDVSEREKGRARGEGARGVGRGEEEGCGGASPHDALNGKPACAARERTRTGGEGEEALLCDKRGSGAGEDGSGGDNGEQLARTEDGRNVSKEQCSRRSSGGSNTAQSVHQGRLSSGRACGYTTDGGAGGAEGGSKDTGEDRVTPCHHHHYLNSNGERLADKALIEDRNGGSPNFRVKDHEEDARNNNSKLGASDIDNSSTRGTAALNTSNRSTSSESQSGSFSTNTSRIISPSSGIERGSKIVHNGFTANENQSDKNNCHTEGEDTFISGKNRETNRKDFTEMGNQSSNARVGSTSSDARPQKISAQARKDKVQSPQPRIDAVHFKKDNSESAESDGGSISIVADLKHHTTVSSSSEKETKGKHVKPKQVVVVAVGDEAKDYSLTEQNKTESTAVNETDRSSGSNVKTPSLSSGDNTKGEIRDSQKDELKARERMSNGSVSSSSSNGTHHQRHAGQIGSETELSKSPPCTTKEASPASKAESNKVGAVQAPNSNILPVTKEATPTVDTSGAAGPSRDTVTTPVTTAATVTQLGVVARPIKLGPKTEDIYAVPLPKSMRSPSKHHPIVELIDEKNDQEAQAMPPPIPHPLTQETEFVRPLPPGKKTNSSVETRQGGRLQEADEVQMRHRSQNTVQVTCQMKKSHTACGGLSRAASSRDPTGEYSDYKGYYYNSSGDGPAYDYFSLGRKPKRQPRIKTLTDSRGMALSLDKLLRLRRQSSSTTSTNSTAQLSGEPSVEDILRTCSEYDMSAGLPADTYRDRTSSDADATRSPLDYPIRPRGPLLSFKEASQIEIPDDWEGFGSLKRPGNAKAHGRGSKKHRSSAREAKFRAGLSGATVQKSDSVRSAPPTSDARQRVEQGPISPQTTEDYLPTYAEIYTERPGARKGELRKQTNITVSSELSVSDQTLKNSSTSISSLGSDRLRSRESGNAEALSSETHSISSQNSNNKKHIISTNAEQSSSKDKLPITDRLSDHSGASCTENIRESFTSSSSSHSSSASTATIVASDQVACLTESHSSAHGAPSSSSPSSSSSSHPDHTQNGSVVITISSGPNYNNSCGSSNIKNNREASGSGGEPPAAISEIDNGDGVSPAVIAPHSPVKPARSSADESGTNYVGQNSSPPQGLIITPDSGSRVEHNKLTESTAKRFHSVDSHTSSPSSSSSNGRDSTSLAKGKKSVSTDSGNSIGSVASSFSGSDKRKMETEETKTSSKTREPRTSEKKIYPLRWLKASDKGSKNKSKESQSSSMNADSQRTQIHLSVTSEPDSRSSSLTTSGSLTSDPRSPLTSGGSLDDQRSPVFSPLSRADSEMSSLTVDTSTSSTSSFPGREGGRVSPYFAAPKSPNHASKLEACEALKWLRAAGFPQYAQMFDDGQFPLELSIVEKDHDFLDTDSLQSLYRRLETLNKYAGMKLESHPRKKTASEEEDEEDFCALSERWEYQKSVRRWSRKDLQTPTSPGGRSVGSAKVEDGNGFKFSSEARDEGVQKQQSQASQRAPSHDSLLADQEDGGQTETVEKTEQLGTSVAPSESSRLGEDTQHQRPHPRLQSEEEEQQNDRHTSSSSSTSSTLSPRLRRAASERIKTAKSLWRKMEGGLKSRKSRRHHHGGNSGSRGATGGALEISDPVLADKGGDMQARLERLQCVDIKQGSSESGVTPVESLSSRLAPAPAATQPSSETTPQNSSGTTTISSTHSTSSSGGESGPDPALRPRPAGSVSSTTQPLSSSEAAQKTTTPDARLSEYYSAQSQLQQNLRQAQQKTSASDGLGNLMEIFLLPQDHQPGRFPTALQNGYIEKDPHLSPAGAGVAGLPDGSRTEEDSFPAGSSQGGVGNQHLGTRGTRASGSNRTSVYDNFGPPNPQSSDTRLLNSKFSPVDENGEDSSPVPRSNRAMSADNAGDTCPVGFPGVKDRSVSFDSASERLASSSSEAADTSRSRSVSCESSSALDERSGSAARDSQSLSSQTAAAAPQADSLPSKGVSHSVSADSYFRDSAPTGSTSDTASVSSFASQDDASSCSGSTLHFSNYEEFEAILKQLYDNISDLTSVIDWDDDESTPPAVDTKSTTPSSTPATTALHVDTPSMLPTSGGTNLRSRPAPGHDPNIDLDLEELDSPLSPTSDPLALSPTASRGEGATDESIDLDQENSSSSSAGDAGSHTADSGSDDAEVLMADLSHDDSLDTIPAVTRERRDSGVGHSLTRAPSDRRRKKIRWHSFQRSHRPAINCRAQQVNALTVGQLVRLQKLALLKLTGIMEKCLPVNKSGWNWMMPRFMKRHKAPDFSDRTVFGVPLSVMVQRTGQPLPQCVLYAMRYLRRTSQSSVGIFRKSGVKSKIQQLRDHLEAHPDTTDFEGMNTYNVADMLKTFFRDLPECLLTNKMSETFRSIYTHVPQTQRLEAMQAAILLLPDENREVLQSILLFLSDISSHQADHQMNASNLAVCFTPTVFQLGRSGSGSPASPKRSRKLGGGSNSSPGTPDPREIMEQKAAHECLHMLITECKSLFTVPPHLFRQLQVISLAHEEPGPLHDLGNSTEEVRAFGQERIQQVLKEAHDRKSHWNALPHVGDVEVYNRKPMDDYPLKEWKLLVDIEAPPIEVLRRIMHERHAWDEDLLSWSVVERLDPHSDIFQYALNTMAPHPSRHYCVLRYWRSDLTKGSCALVTMSVEHTDTGSIQGVWALDLGSYFLMEPCGAGRSRLTYITRVDTRGRTPEWYTKMYGHIQANFLERLKDSFKQDASGPETKV